MSSTDPVVIASYARTPMGGFQGVLTGVKATELGAAAVKAAVERAGASPDAIEQIVMGCVLPATLVSLGRIGAHGQYVLELLVVSMLCLLRVTHLPAIRGREVLVSIQILILFLYTPLFIFLEEGLWDIPANRAACRIYPLLADRPGPILSQHNS